MSPAITTRRRTYAASAAGGRNLAVAGALLIGGFLLNVAFTLAHPSGEEDNHQAIFAEYADSDAWVAVHIGQFVGVSLALAGLLVLYRVMRADAGTPLLATFGAAATVATAATWAILQGLDGIGLKEATEAWAGASEGEQAARFADAETVRWLEWGFQSYFRLLLGTALLLFGAAILRARVVAGWLGWVAILGGLFSVVIGVDVGYSGLASGLQDALGIAFLVVVVAFAGGLLASGTRPKPERVAARS